MPLRFLAARPIVWISEVLLLKLSDVFGGADQDRTGDLLNAIKCATRRHYVVRGRQVCSILELAVPPQPPSHQLPETSRVVATSILGGLHHEYRLETAA